MYIEEVGTANFFALIDGKLITPKTRGTILPGITRKSILKLASEKFSLETEERDISYKEVFEESCTETFCTGTAAVITPISSISFEDRTRTYNEGKPGEITTQLYNELTGIQRLEREDPFNWIEKV
jgi:branched-chain amino acid aminotransferase